MTFKRVLIFAGLVLLAVPSSSADAGWRRRSRRYAYPVYVAPAPVYVQPYPGYVQPYPGYVQPAPVYVGPASVRARQVPVTVQPPLAAPEIIPLPQPIPAPVP
jgi:hypothetical protein